MSKDRRAIFQLLAAGRIKPSEAERLLAASTADRDAVWALIGCALVVAVSQLHSLTPLAHLFKLLLVGSFPMLHQVFASILVSFGG